MSPAVRADDLQATILFPGGIAVEVSLAGKSLDLRAWVRERPALLRVGTAAEPRITVDIVERRGPEE
jgi:hypothetical protein